MLYQNRKNFPKPLIENLPRETLFSVTSSYLLTMERLGLDTKDCSADVAGLVESGTRRAGAELDK